MVEQAEVTATDNSLGYLVTVFPMSESEKARINQLIADKGMAREIVVKYASRTDLFRDAWHKVKLPGARPVKKGQHSMNAQALKSFFDFLRMPKEVENELCWDIYEQCVAMFVEAELKALDTLLRQCNYTCEDPSSQELLQEICKNSSKFGVTEADVERFYECIWLDRVNDLSELLKLCRK